MAAYDHATRIDDGTTRTDEVLAPSGRVLKRTVTSPPGGTVTENTVKGYTGGSDSPNWSQSVTGGSYTNYLGSAIITGTTAVYQVSNWHGDIVGTVTQAGVFTAQAYPDEYGNVTTVPSSRLGWLGSQQRFVTAPALGIIRMGVRLYDPKLGRFLAQDPIEGGSCNDYDYTCANPIGGLDLTGTCVKGLGWFCDAWNFGWAVIRAQRNLWLTNIGLNFARSNGGRCSQRSGYMWVCRGVGNTFGKSFTLGNTFLQQSRDRVPRHLLRHETKHSDQFAMASAVGGKAGQITYIVSYYGFAIWDMVSKAPDTQVGCKNPYEKLANLRDGNYNNC